MIKVRNYQKSDAKTLAAIYFDTIHNINIRDYSEEQVNSWAPVDLLANEIFWQEKFGKSKPFVAVIEDMIVGFAEFEPNGHIDCFYVHHEYQGKAIGSALIAAIFDAGKTQEINRIYAEVSITAKPFFEAKGFKLVKEQMVNIRGAELKNFVMEKRHFSDSGGDEFGSADISEGKISASAENVCELYNHIADWFGEARDKPVLGFVEKPYLEIVASALPENANILDLGCGTGFPVADYFMKSGHNVTGIDGSEVMIQKCRQRYPSGDWLLGDMRQIDLGRKFDAIIAWDSFFYLPHDDQRAMFSIFKAHAKQGAMLLFTSGPKHGEVIGQMQGYDFYHASLAFDEYQKLLAENDFTVITNKVEDPDCGEHTVWVAKYIGNKSL